MDFLKIILIILLVILVIYLLVLLFVLKVSYFDVFNRRLKDYQPVYNELIKKHPDFKHHPHSYINNDNNKIQGEFYYYDLEHYHGLIINAHGMDNCKETQLARLEYFARNGYLIYSYDNTGVGESEGKNIVGLGHSVIDLRNTINHLATIKALQPMKWALYGHSWGGYAVSCVSNYQLDHDISVIISKAGFNSVYDEFYFLGSQKFGKLTKLFVGPIMFFENLRIKENKNKQSVDGLDKTKAHVLIMHSYDDPTVGFSITMKKYFPRLANKENITFKFFQDRGHIIDQQINSLGRYYSQHVDKKDPHYQQHYATLLVKDMDNELVLEQLHFLNKYMINK